MGIIWHLCIANMKQRGIRTGLTILGVVIGVISVVSMLALGLGVKNELLSEATMDGSVTDVRIYGSNEGKRRDKMITDRRIQDIEEISHVEGVTPMLTAGTYIKYDRYSAYMEFTGVPRTYLEAMKPERGSVPEVNGTKLSVLMGAGALNLFYNENTGVSYAEAKAPTKEEQKEMDEEDERLKEEAEKVNAKNTNAANEGGTQAAGQNGIKRWNDWSGEYLEAYLGYDESGKSIRVPITGMLSEYDFQMYCDMETMKKILKRNAVDGVIEGQPTDEDGNPINEWVYSYAVVKVDDVENVDTIVKRLSDMGYQAESNKEYVDEVQREIKIIQILLGGIGAIALVVAVIGIGNTMTTSVYDRINEIGVLKVLGCDPDELMGLFLLESGILGGIGGVIGLICSYGISRLGINKLGVKLLEMPKNTQLAVIPPWLAVSSVVLAILLGIFAGYLPAKWASKMRPIEAVKRNT